MGVLRSGSVEDLSQRVRDLQGIVVMPPESSGNTMILSIQPSGNIVVDTSSQTTFHDPSGKTSSLDEITDADIVDVHGVLDGALGEMTLTDSVTRLGP
jgi:hypothetical protein